MLAGTPREELWLDAAGVSHTVNKRKKQGHFTREIVTICIFLI